MPGNSRPNSNHQPATIADVARQAGVSIATVSRVINQTAQVKDETADRVRQAIVDLGFMPQAAARNLARRKTNTIGLLIPAVGSDFFFPILNGIERAVRQAGFELLIAIQPEEPHRAELSPKGSPLGSHNTDGLLVFGSLVEERALAQYAQMNFPVVLLYHSAPESSGITSVMIENRNGARKLVSHLIEVHSCRHIAFLRGPAGHQDLAWRERGYCQALADHGLECTPKLIGSGDFSEEGGQAAVEKWYARAAQAADVGAKDACPDAIFAGDDATAIGVMTALNRLGISVPSQVAVVGFDDILPARYLNPPLTTVRAPTEKVGYQAVQQLVRRIHGESVEPMVLLPTELVIRQSCGCG